MVPMFQLVEIVFYVTNLDHITKMTFNKVFHMRPLNNISLFDAGITGFTV